MPQAARIHGRNRRRPPTETEKKAHAFYTSARWRKLRAAHLQAKPLCVECLRDSRYTPATQVDHRVPRSVDRSRELDPANLDSLCASHHSQKTRRAQLGIS